MIENHREVVAGVRVPFPFGSLSVGGRGRGAKVQLESEEFNRRFTVRADNTRFAYAVLHPLTMEFLLAVAPPGFAIAGGLMRFDVRQHDSVTVGLVADFAHEFFRRVPTFVWADLGLRPPRFRSTLPALEQVRAAPTRLW